MKRSNGHEPDSSSELWQPTLRCMLDVESRPIDWLWPPRIAAGRMTLIVGMPGIGKSFVTCDLASRISTGTPWPDGSPCRQGAVIFITAEDDPHDTIRPRLDAHLADVSRVHLLTGIHRCEDGKTRELMFSLGDVDVLDRALEQVADCRLVVIDPIGSFLGCGTDAHRDNEVRAVLAPVAKLAEKYGCAVVVVAHRRKSVGTIADDTALGSRAFTGIARSVWHLCRDPEQRERRLLLPGKCNLAAEPTGLAFSIMGERPAVHWECDPVEMTADDALVREQGAGGESSALDEAVDWLRNALKDGARPGAEMKKRARADGIALRTLERARSKLGVKAAPDGFGGPWVWSLPARANNSDSATLSQDSAQCAKKVILADSVQSVADSDAGDDWGEL